MSSSEYSKLVSMALELAIVARAPCIRLLALNACGRIANDEDLGLMFVVPTSLPTLVFLAHIHLSILLLLLLIIIIIICHTKLTNRKREYNTFGSELFMGMRQINVTNYFGTIYLFVCNILSCIIFKTNMPVYIKTLN